MTKPSLSPQSPTRAPRLIVGAVLILLSTAVYAADPLGTVADNVRGNLDEVLKLGTATVFVIGFLLVGIGVFLIWRMGRHQGMHSPATLFSCIAAVVAPTFQPIGWPKLGTRRSRTRACTA